MWWQLRMWRFGYVSRLFTAYKEMCDVVMHGTDVGERVLIYMDANY